MKLLSQINVLKEKQRKGIVFREEERNMAEIISKCSSRLYKSRLIDILALERENWSYRILKSLIHDPDEKVAEKAVDTIAVFQREVDFQRMFEEAADANGFVKSWIVMITGHIGWTRDIRNEIFMERMEYLAESSQESGYVPFYSYRWMFLVSEDETYFTKILDGIEHKNHEMRYHAMYVIDGMLETRALERKHLEEIQKRLYANSKCEVRYCRVYRERILRVVNQQLNRSREEWIYPEEAVFYERISPMCRDQITPEVLIAYCVFRVYYPIDDGVDEVLKILYQTREYWNDNRFLIFAAYMESVYGEKAENIFLKKLTETKQAEQKAIVFLLQAIWEMEKVPEDYINHKALKFAEKAVQFSDSVPRAYDIIARFTSIETDQHRSAVEQSRKQKRRITLKEVEEWPLEKLYSFDTFLEMTILRRTEEPENFTLRNMAWDEEKF